MVELKATSPCAGLLPIKRGGVSLQEVDLGVITSIAPFAGQNAATSNTLEKAHSLSFPAPNRSTQSDQSRALWFGRDMVLLIGGRPDAAVEKVAATTDQSDAWACLSLTGAGAVDVLARLVPVDLRPAVFASGHTARTLLGHMNVSITRLENDTLLILVFRSMAATLVEDIQEAMAAVAARG